MNTPTVIPPHLTDPGAAYRKGRQVGYDQGFPEGYDSAIEDLLTALDDGGEDALRAWAAEHHSQVTP